MNLFGTEGSDVFLRVRKLKVTGKIST